MQDVKRQTWDSQLFAGKSQTTGKRQLLSIGTWSKSLPGFQNLDIEDQITTIQYSWVSLVVFGLWWRSYKYVGGQMLYFVPDLILNEQQMKELSFYSLCRSHRRLTKLAQKSFLYKSIATS